MNDAQLDAFLRPIYYSKGGFNGVIGLHSKLPKGSASIGRVRKWIRSQNVGRYTQAVPPDPVYAYFSETVPNKIHQADLLYLPNDKGFKYALCVVDVASRFKAARPLRNKTADAVAKQLGNIYKSNELNWPETMMVDDGSEFKGAVTTLLQKHDVKIRRAQPGHHRSQAFVESFHRSLAQRLFRAQYQKELTSGKTNKEWISRLQAVVTDMNATKTRLTGLAPKDAIKLGRVPLKRPTYPKETTPLSVGTNVYLATNEEDPKDTGKRRATDPYWTHKPYQITKRVMEPGQPILYYTAFSKHGFTRSQIRLP